MSEEFKETLHRDLSYRLRSGELPGKFTPFDESKIQYMTLKETLITLEMFQRDAWVTRRKIEWRYNQCIQFALENNHGVIIGRDGTQYADPQQFKEILFNSYTEGGHLHYGEWYRDTQRVIPLLMIHLHKLERELHTRV